MAVTNNIRLPLLETYQAQKESTVNESLYYLDDIVAGYRAIAVSGGDYTLTELQARSCVLKLTGSLSGDVLLPSREQVHIVWNTTSAAVTVRPVGGTGETIPQGHVRLIYCDGTDIYPGVTTRVLDDNYGDVIVTGDGTIWTIDPTLLTHTVPFTFASGSVLTPGAKRVYWSPQHNGTLTGWRLLADPVGDLVVDIWKSDYAGYPPTVADTITAAAKPTLTSAVKAESSTLTGWTTTFSAGDIFECALDSVADVTKAILLLTYVITR